MNNKNYWVSYYLYKAHCQMLQYALSLRREDRYET